MLACPVIWSVGCTQEVPWPVQSPNLYTGTKGAFKRQVRPTPDFSFPAALLKRQAAPSPCSPFYPLLNKLHTQTVCMSYLPPATLWTHPLQRSFSAVSPAKVPTCTEITQPTAWEPLDMSSRQTTGICLEKWGRGAQTRLPGE